MTGRASERLEVNRGGTRNNRRIMVAQDRAESIWIEAEAEDKETVGRVECGVGVGVSPCILPDAWTPSVL